MLYKWCSKIPKKYLILLGLDILVFAASIVFSYNHPLTEKIYFRTIYPIIVAITSFFSDLLPFSIQEWLIGGTIFTLLYLGVRGIVRLYKKQQQLKQSALNLLRTLFLVGSTVYILFYFNWGFNYFRVRLREETNYKPQRISKKRLIQTLQYTIRQANKLSKEKYPSWETINNDLEIKLAKIIKIFDGKTIYSGKKIKRFISGYLALTGFTGVCLPFLHEAHVARDLFPVEIPFISAHEKVHLKGRAMESEANYFAYLTCLSSKHKAVQYSAHFALLRYLLYALPKKERPFWWKKLEKNIKKDFKRISERNRKKSPILKKVSRKLYNSYLKSNTIKEGTANYRIFVQLILGYKLPNQLTQLSPNSKK